MEPEISPEAAQEAAKQAAADAAAATSSTGKNKLPVSCWFFLENMKSFKVKAVFKNISEVAFPDTAEEWKSICNPTTMVVSFGQEDRFCCNYPGP